MKYLIAIPLFLAATALPAQAYDRCAIVQTQFQLASDLADMVGADIESELAKLAVAIAAKDTVASDMAVAMIRYATIQNIGHTTKKLALMEQAPKCFKAGAAAKNRPIVEKWKAEASELFKEYDEATKQP